MIVKAFILFFFGARGASPALQYYDMEEENTFHPSLFVPQTTFEEDSHFLDAQVIVGRLKNDEDAYDFDEGWDVHRVEMVLVNLRLDEYPLDLEPSDNVPRFIRSILLHMPHWVSQFKTRDGSTLAHLFAEYDMNDELQFILDQFPEMAEIPDNDGNFPLDIQEEVSEQKDFLDTQTILDKVHHREAPFPLYEGWNVQRFEKVLLNLGLDVNSHLWMTEVIRAVLDEKFYWTPSFKTREGLTLAHLCVMHDEPESLKRILKKFPELVHVADDNGNFPFDMFLGFRDTWEPFFGGFDSQVLQMFLSHDSNTDALFEYFAKTRSPKFMPLHGYGLSTTNREDDDCTDSGVRFPLTPEAPAEVHLWFNAILKHDMKSHPEKMLRRALAWADKSHENYIHWVLKPKLRERHPALSKISEFMNNQQIWFPILLWKNLIQYGNERVICKVIHNLTRKMLQVLARTPFENEFTTLHIFARRNFRGATDALLEALRDIKNHLIVCRNVFNETPIQKVRNQKYNRILQLLKQSNR